MKKTLMLSAAAAAFLLAGGGAAWAQCDLNDAQLAHGWQCDSQTSTDTVTTFVQQGSSSNCRVFDATVTTTTSTATNPGGNVVDDKGGEEVVTGDPVARTGAGSIVTCP